ncbi:MULTISPECIES: relaxase/mobilization nuclease domain-containing protein [unclassified Streptomyces]|uniref:relaxase/mobilization nuclease domain-containing protein n=1 Tax=unclassified Streptomyces TaxID=2593676 RepID=UPI0033F6DCEB
MIPNAAQGRDVPGLVRYLFGPGKANEHRDQRVIAASDDVVLLADAHCGGPGELAHLAAELEAPRQLFGTEVKDGHVWHCSLSLAEDEGQLSDERWADVARRMVAGMDFEAVGDKAPCRWVAVHHGPSKNGNDHIHLVVNLVRNDGSAADIWQYKRRSQRVCGQIERDMGLRVVEGRASGRTLPGFKRGEKEAATRRGQPEPARMALARRVRAAAVTAASETDFVRNLRGSGVIVRPRYAKGGRTAVIGYSVARHTTDEASPIWYGGGRLGRDLTLSQLRGQWPDSDPSQAVTTWGERGAGPHPKVGAHMRDESAWQVAAEQIQNVREQLAEVPPDDTVRWAQAAQEAAGVLAVLSARMEPHSPGPLAQAADVLARSAQRTFDTRRAAADTPGQLRGAAMVARYSRSGGAGSAGEAAFLLALRNTMRALHQMHKARAERDQARQIEQSAQGDLRRLQQMRQTLSQSPGAGPARGIEPDRSGQPYESPEHGSEYGR